LYSTLWKKNFEKKTLIKIPLVPFIPFLSVFLNVYMMTTLSATTWLRFIIWFAIGIV